MVLSDPVDGVVLCRTTEATTPSVGYFPRVSLMTENEIYERFILEEDERLLAEIEEKKRAQDQEYVSYMILISTL